MITVYDSLTRRLRPFEPRVPGHVSIYTCGITPYDHSHVGHARPSVVWDVIRKHFRRRGFIVTFVQNFTDIDDKIIRRAATELRPYQQLTAEFMEEYLSVLRQLQVEPADYMPRVTENIEGIVKYIERLIDRQYAYITPDGVYFRVAKDATYGALSHRRVEDMQEELGDGVGLHKEQAGDFALWKAAKTGEPAWDSPWGQGRPGWHIECSYLSQQFLGDHFDLHGGGLDLIFPHHENERAQSRAYLGEDAASIWMHNGLIMNGSVKMSKSLQNGVTLHDLLSHYSPSHIRSYLLSVHYRSPLDFDEQHLKEWVAGMRRIERLWDEVKAAPPPRMLPDRDWAANLVQFEDEFLEALDEDFNTAKAYAVVFDMVRAANRGIEEGLGEVVYGLARRNLVIADEALQMFADRIDPEETHQDTPGLLDGIVALRDMAREKKNFALSDSLRDVLLSSGYEVLDTAEGTRVRRQ